MRVVIAKELTLGTLIEGLPIVELHWLPNKAWVKYRVKGWLTVTVPDSELVEVDR